MLQINILDYSPASVIEVAGRVDSSTALQLGEALTQTLEKGHYNLVLDLANVDYMSSAGLREIVNALKKVRGKGDVRLAQPNDRVREVLEMAGLDTIVQVFANSQSALGSYS